MGCELDRRDAAKSSTIDSPEAVAAVEWLVDLYTNPEWEKMMPPGVLSWTDSSNNEAYLGGKVAYTQNAGTVYAKAVADGLEVAGKTMFDIPKGGPVLQDFNGLGGMYAHHIMGSKNPTKARELIMSFFNEEVMTGIYNSAVAYAVPGYEGPMWDLGCDHRQRDFYEPEGGGARSVRLDLPVVARSLYGADRCRRHLKSTHRHGRQCAQRPDDRRPNPSRTLKSSPSPSSRSSVRREHKLPPVSQRGACSLGNSQSPLCRSLTVRCLRVRS